MDGYARGLVAADVGDERHAQAVIVVARRDADDDGEDDGAQRGDDERDGRVVSFEHLQQEAV